MIINSAAAELDGLVMLRYHTTPSLRSHPPVRWEPVSLKDDLVPFLGFHPPPGASTLELDFSP